jgi:hypothetical protein
MSTFVGIFGVSGVVLIGAVTIWASLASAGKTVPLGIKLISLLGALGLIAGAVTMFLPEGRLDDGIPQAPPTQDAVPVKPSAPISATPGTSVYDLKRDDPSKSWRMNPISKLGSAESMAVNNGEMDFDFKSGGGSYVLNLNLNAPELVNSEIEAVIERLGGPNTMSYGLLFRSNNQIGQMYFLINSDQKYGVFVHTKDSKTMADRIPWTFSSSIDPNGPNKLKVIAREKQVSIFVNDSLLNTFQVDQVFAGAAGAYVILYEPNETGRIRIANYRVAHASAR